MVAMPVPTDTGTLVKGPPQGRWTYADWEKLPDDGNRYEIIDGVLYMTTTPSYFHHWITKQLYRFLGTPAEDQGIAEAGWAPIGVLMPGCEPVIPDFFLIRRERIAIIEDGRVRGVPDLIVEIISPGSRSFDEGLKLEAYANAGVPEYAVIDPKTRALRYYKLVEPGRYSDPQQFGLGESLTFEAAPGILVPIAALFEGAPDTTL
jgi:Uma2 family endonuclease